MNERIKYLRKELLHITLEEFGQRIGMGKSAVSKIERGENSGTDQTIKSICREFNVREDWLRSGTGEPFAVQSRNEQIFSFVDSIMSSEDDSFKKRLVSALAKLGTEEWKVLEEIARKCVNDDDASDEASTDELSTDEPSTEELEDEYKKSRSGSALGTDLFASNMNGDGGGGSNVG